jgi:hypothetical protein
MDKHWYARPEAVVAGLLLVWVGSAAVYALVFSY